MTKLAAESLLTCKIMYTGLYTPLGTGYLPFTPANLPLGKKPGLGFYLSPVSLHHICMTIFYRDRLPHFLHTISNCYKSLEMAAVTADYTSPYFACNLKFLPRAAVLLFVCG